MDPLRIGGHLGMDVLRLFDGRVKKVALHDLDPGRMTGKPGFDLYDLNAEALTNAMHILSDSVNLLVVDADHSYEGVMWDLKSWGHRTRLCFIHDYDGTTAPRQYPGVREACHEFFGRKADETGGWSALYEVLKT